MIQVGQQAPDFAVQSLDGTEFREVSLGAYKGKWLCLYFYPMDFTFVCPLEIKAFSDMAPEFRKRGCMMLGGSCDSVYSHLGWTQSKRELANLNHPLFSDYTKTFAATYGVLDHETGSAKRACFLIDPHGVVRFVYVTDLNVERNPAEVLRVLEAFQKDEMCPCNSKNGEGIATI